MKTFKRHGFYSLRELRRLGAEVTGAEVFVSRSASISAGVRICSPCHITGRTAIGGGTALLAGCVVEGARIGSGCTLGPWCNVRGGCEIGDGCRVGDFVELKNAALGGGCRVAHLAYIGDAALGEGVNVGCGVVFANYDGRAKHRTRVGNNVFIGCNSNIVAPADIADGAFIAAGTTVGGEVEGGAFVISRPPLKIVPEGGRGRYGDG